MLFPLFAVEPIAVWNGDFATTTKGDVTLSANGNTITATGALKISQKYGATFCCNSGNLNTCTIIVQGSNLDLEDASDQYILALHLPTINSAATGNYVGCALLAKNAGCAAIWNGSHTKTVRTESPISTKNATLVFTYNSTKGLSLYEIVSNENTQLACQRLLTTVGAESGQACTSNESFSGFTIGASQKDYWLTPPVPASEWTIERIAIFNSVLSEEEIKDYRFPSEEVVLEGNLTTDELMQKASDINSTTFLVTNAVTVEVQNGTVAKRAQIRIAETGQLTLRNESLTREDWQVPLFGKGAVLTDGDLRMCVTNKFEGGLTVQSGTLSTQYDWGFGGSGEATTNAWIAVEENGTVDVANTGNFLLSFNIAGKGAGGQGAIINSGSNFATNKRGAYKVILSADAMINLAHDWSLRKNASSESILDLNGYTLTKRGQGQLYLHRTTFQNLGKLALAGGTVKTYSCKDVKIEPAPGYTFTSAQSPYAVRVKGFLLIIR